MRRSWLYPLLLFLVAFAFRMLHLIGIRSLSDYLILDSRFYFEWAERILGGDWIGGQVFDQSPLYAYFLAPVLWTIRTLGSGLGIDSFSQNPIFWVRAFQATLGAAACVLLVRVARRVCSPAEAYLAGFLAAIYGPFIYYDTMIMKTFLAVIFSLLCLLALFRSEGTRRNGLIAAGLFIGLTTLVRDNFLLMFPFLLAGLIPLMKERRPKMILRAAGWMLAGTAVVILPVTLRNSLIAGEFSLLTAGGGEVFYIGNNPTADGRYRPPCMNVSGTVQCVRADPEYEHDDFRTIAAALSGEKLSPMQSSRFWFRKGMAFVLTHPLDYSLLLGKKLSIFLKDAEIGDNYNFDLFRQVSPVLYLPLPTFGLVMSLALLGMASSMRRWREFSLLYAMAGGYTATVLLFFNFSRFRIPAVSILIIFAGVGIAWIFRQAAATVRSAVREGYPAGIRAAGILLIGIAGTAIPLTWSLAKGPSTILLTVQHQVQLGDLLRQTGRVKRAVREYGKAKYLLGDAPIEERLDLLGGTSPDTYREILQEERFQHGLNFRIVHARVYEGLGQAYAELDQMDQAAESYEESIRIFLDGTAILLRLADIYDGMENLPAAARTREQALKIEEDFGTRYDLAGVYFRMGDPLKALQILRNATEDESNLTPQDRADFHFGLGLILMDGLNRPEDAIYHFEASLSLAPDHPQAEEIRKNLQRLRTHFRNR